MANAKEIYHNYYDGQSTAIGGEERFTWVSTVLLKGIADKDILDVGCGEGSLLAMLRGKGNRVYGLEASDSGREASAQKGINCQSTDISRDVFPFNDNMFDVVTCLEVLEHVENPYHALVEMKRVLRDGGMLVVSIPNPKSLHEYVYPGLFAFEAFQLFLEQSGFKVVSRQGWGQTGMLNRLRNALLLNNSAVSRWLAGLIYLINRKRNALFRNHLGTPESFCHCLNYIGINNKTVGGQLERVAATTKPVKE
jgi:SAM-dependent methyltransferase